MLAHQLGFPLPIAVTSGHLELGKAMERVWLASQPRQAGLTPRSHRTPCALTCSL